MIGEENVFWQKTDQYRTIEVRTFQLQLPFNYNMKLKHVEWQITERVKVIWHFDVIIECSNRHKQVIKLF